MTTSAARTAHVPLAPALFAALFAAQAGVISLSPVLGEVAADVGVSTAVAGQLRAASGLAAGVTAVALARAARRRSLQRLMRVGAALLVAGSVATTLAPTFIVLAAAQVVVGISAALLVSSATAAAAEWAPVGDGGRLLSRTLIGAPAAWICGMPVAGVLANVDWRYSLALPIVAAAAAAAALRRRPPTSVTAPVPVPNGLTATRATVRWTIAELLANAGWTGVLVYAGALFVESYSASLTLTGFVLSGAAAAYVAGNLASRRLVEGDLRTHLVRLSALLAAGIAALGTLRHDLVVSALLLALCGSLAGGRTFLANVFGLQLAPERRLALMSARTAALNFGYFVGAGVGGAALALGGYAALGVALGTLVAAGTLQYADLRRGHVVTPRLRSA